MPNLHLKKNLNGLLRGLGIRAEYLDCEIGADPVKESPVDLSHLCEAATPSRNVGALVRA
jgi:hypothetical protein